MTVENLDGTTAPSFSVGAAKILAPTGPLEVRDQAGALEKVLAAPGATGNELATVSQLPVSAVPGLRPLLGTFQGWWGVATPGVANLAFYGRILLPEGTYVGMEAGVVAGAGTIDLGVYADDGAVPTPSPTGPVLASTGPLSVAALVDDFHLGTFTAPLVVSAPAFYWLAAIFSDPTVQLMVSGGSFNAAWRKRFLALALAPSATLGALPTLLGPTSSAMAYLAITS